ASDADGGRSLFSGDASRSASSVVGLWSSVIENDVAVVAEPLFSFLSRSVAALCGFTTSQYTPIRTSEMQTKVVKVIINSIGLLFLVFSSLCSVVLNLVANS